MSGYSTDRAYSDRFIPAIGQIVGPELITVSTDEEDRTHATDMTILKARDMKIACRVRRPGYLEKYGWQFTMRCKRDSGHETELSKVIKGWGDWMFYAFAKSDGSIAFDRWFLINLAHWRAQIMRREDRPTLGWTPNGDGTYFAWFDVRSFAPTPSILIASSEEVPRLSDDEVREFWRKRNAPNRMATKPLFGGAGIYT